MLNSEPHPAPEGASPAICVRDVSFSYPTKRTLRQRSVAKKRILHGLNFDILEGSVVGVVGKNGVGKSTLLGLMAGIMEPDHGTVLHRRGLRAKLLSLQTGFNPQLTGRENIRISGMLLGMTSSEVNERMEEIVSLADIGNAIDQPIRTYSTGMRARVGFATVYYTHADVYLLDEVFAVGDMEFSQKAQDLMEKKIRSQSTVVMVSHGEFLLKKLCDTLIWIEDGRVAAFGPTDPVWEEYMQTHLARHS
jgi:lipopolysaccharide transport system ATP-binding protein